MEARSYENINYSIRPAKSIERKMFVELIQHLSVFYPLNCYEYIGFGSTHFSDFSLIHRTLGISQLISIESDKENSDRFDFNIPHSCIKMRYGPSNEVLPNIDWKKGPKIIWLDYDGKLNSSVLEDVRTVIANAVEGSLVLFSVNAQPYQAPTGSNMDIAEENEYKLEQLKLAIGEDKLPTSLTSSDLTLKRLSRVYRNVLNDEIISTLMTRNGGVPDTNPSKLKYEQLINMVYKDGAKMLTIGGIIYNDHQKVNHDSAKFNELKFYSNNDSEFPIEIPQLTFKEISLLDSLLPDNIDPETGEVLDPAITHSKLTNFSNIVPVRDIKKYSEVYRYFPIFAESNL